MLKIYDNANLLGSASELQSLSNLSLDVAVVTGNFANRGVFEGAVSQAVTGPRFVAIGIDAGHHYVSVHFGTSAGIPRGEWDAIRSSGNADFRAHNWAAGIEHIARAAVSEQTQVQVPASGQTAQPVSVHVEQTSNSALWIAGFVLLVVSCAAAWLIVKSRKREREHEMRMAELMEETTAKSAINEELAAFDRKLMGEPPQPFKRAPRRPTRAGYSFGEVAEEPYASPSPAPVVVQSSNNDFLTGMLVADALSDHHHHHVERVVERVVESPRRSSYDSGGSSSDWGSSSSYDSGSSSGSFDSGGGGFDGGGSGGDW